MFASLAKDQTVSQYWISRQADHTKLVELAFLASGATAMDLPLLLKQIDSPDPLMRYWATRGCLILGESASPAKENLEKRLTDEFSSIRVAAAHALIQLGEPSHKKIILAELDKKLNDAATLNALNTLIQIKAVADISDAWIEQIKQEKGVGSYLYRCATRIKTSLN